MYYKKKFNNAFFLKSISNIKKEKLIFGLEIAFVGYSNVGKSSIINILTNKKKLSRVSKIPGRTQLINVFQVSSKIRLLDFPGYGYTRVPQIVSIKWKKMLLQYLKMQTCLIGLILILDIRRSIRIIDTLIINLALVNHIPIVVLLNKSDKLVSYKSKIMFNLIKKEVDILSKHIDVILFSTVKKIGIVQLRNILSSWISKS